MLKAERQWASGGIIAAKVEGWGVMGKGRQARPAQQSGQPDRAIRPMIRVWGPADGPESVKDRCILAVIEGAAGIGGHGSQNVCKPAHNTDFEEAASSLGVAGRHTRNKAEQLGLT